MDTERIPVLFGLSLPGFLTELKSGHINRTFLASCGGKRYILQSLNREVFHRPQEVMENISRIEAAFALSDEAVRIPHYLTANAQNYVTVGGEVWRMYEYIGSEQSPQADDDSLIGTAFGAFLRIIEDVKLTEPIEHFHDYTAYFSRLELLSGGRADRALMLRLWTLGEKLSKAFGSVPKRNIHGDAKADNVIIGERYTVIDLDTSMEGYAAFDFGDMIRSVSGLPADISRIKKVTEGFAEGLGGVLAAAEEESLYCGILYAVGELAVRYLTDFYSEKPYFRGKTPQQCRLRALQLMAQLDIFEKSEAAIRGIIDDSFRKIQYFKG